MKYLSTPLEDLVTNIYSGIGIRKPGHSIEEIANRMNILISNWKLPFAIPRVITLDPLESDEKNREIFAHELCHQLQHVGDQLGMPEAFRKLQECQAHNFALQFCVPTFMLQKIKMPELKCECIALIADLFGISNEFAEKRLLHYERQLLGSRLHYLFKSSIDTSGDNTNHVTSFKLTNTNCH
ncbi:ImmA/IrrE family metallo-endopeptidase [Virgibacillus halodenitrificans]|uniref:ImmA/IrrE family metallo-endopeptidase n=1 Tax=Virgibacillus halodenitrificans TaxID=1482 RepID=UPI00136EFFC2|nr:ImmA/IrrE family metallo-endopeptidase [Virgibacillus halodenitrificans]